MKKNPIITINVPKGMLKKGEELLPLNRTTPKGNLYIQTYDRFVTNTGRMFRMITDGVFKEIGGSLDARGYRVVRVPCSDGRWHEIKMHRAVLCTFNPIDKEKMDKKDVNHIKGKEKSNNNMKNIEWISHRKNIIDAVDQGLINSISPDKIRKILKLAELGLTDVQICSVMDTGLTPDSLTQLRTGQGRYGERLKKLGLSPVKFKKYLKEDDYRRIYELVDEGLTDSEIASMVNSTASTVANIRLGKSDCYKAKLEEYGREAVRKMAKITDESIIYIFKAAGEGKTDEQIANDIGSTVSTVQAIRSGQKQYIDRVTALGLEPVKIGGGIITDDDLKMIIKLAKEGKSDKAISATTGIPWMSVKTARQGGNVYSERLYKLGLEPVLLRVKRPLSDNDYREIIRLAKEGVSDEELSARFDRTPKGIQAIRIGQDKNKEILEKLGLEPVRTCTRQRNKG